MADVERQENGRRTPLFTDEELAMAKRHRKKKVVPEMTFQQRLIDDPAPSFDALGPDSIIDPERKTIKVEKDLDNPSCSHKNSLINEEIRHKRMELRKKIGLPVARGKDPHVKDDFYKLLVKRVVKYDNFGIFNEFDRVITDSPPELDLKINQVKEVIDELLNGGLNLRERYRRFYEFTQEYKEKWGE
jgi:hypothetical protein